MTLPFEALSPAELRARTSAKWTFHGPDVLPLWVAEMDVLPAPEVVEALTSAVRRGDTGYPGAGRRYAEAFGAFAEARWGWAPNPADTAMCADVMTGINVLIGHVTAPGDAVVIPMPVYPPFALVTGGLGRRVVAAPLTDAGRLDVTAIDTAVGDSGARALLLCSPHNPTGAVHTAAELEALAALAHRHGLTVIVDEVHAPLVPRGATFVPWLAVTDSGFVSTSAAKAFNLAGLKAGLIVAGPGSRASMRGLPDWVRYGASHLGVIGHAAGYEADPAWLDAVNDNIAANRELLGSLLADRLPAVVHREPEATYLAWLDCRGLGLGDDPAQAFLVRGRVALTPAPPFGPGSSGFARLNFACSSAVLTEALDRMASVVG